MRLHVRKLVELLSNKLPLEAPIYEFGSYIVEGQEELANLRPLFPGKRYIGIDMRPGPGVDLVMDIAPNYPELGTFWRLPDDTMQTVLMLDTIEHVEYPREAVRNIRYNMGRDSIFVMTGPFYFKIHDYPSDYWRFTQAAFSSLLKPFDAHLTVQVGVELFPHTIVGIGLNGTTYTNRIGEIQELLDLWRLTCIP